MSQPATRETGTAAASIPALYERHASEFARRRAEGPWPDLVWIERFAARLTGAATILDLGCGMGVPVARTLAARGHAVTGIDTSQRMIDLARVNVPAAEFEVGDMRTFVPACTFGAILAWDSFFHLSPGTASSISPMTTSAP